MRRDVWVRGAGAISPLGGSWPAARERLAAGTSAVCRVSRFDVEGFPCTVAASIDREFDEPDRRTALARIAAMEALEGVARPAPDRIGVWVGAESGRATFATVLALSRAAGGGAAFDHRLFGERARALAGRIDAAMVSPAAVASRLAQEIGALGPAETVSLACASGLSAIVEAARALRRGEVDLALAGGVGADVDPLMLAGFGKLGALSAKGISRPFDARRDGFVVGEGAAFVVLAAERGGARARITGIGRSLDAFHLTAPDPEGDGAARAMRAALEDAKVAPGAVGYLQAHGTSTPLNDAVEAKAIRRVFGDALPRVSSVKGALGHWVAGAGAIGLLAALAAVENGIALPTAGLERPDEPLPHVMGAAARIETRAAMVNAFAFGGANASVVLEAA